MNMDKEEALSITEVFCNLKATADEFGAAGADFKFEDDEWIYQISVKRKKQ